MIGGAARGGCALADVTGSRVEFVGEHREVIGTSRNGKNVSNVLGAGEWVVALA